MRDLLSKRNFSILAHGLIPMTREVYEKLLEKVINYELSIIGNLKILLRDSEFAKLS